MTETATLNPTVTAPGAFTTEQKEFLSGFMAGVAQRGIHPTSARLPLATHRRPA